MPSVIYKIENRGGVWFCDQLGTESQSLERCLFDARAKAIQTVLVDLTAYRLSRPGMKDQFVFLKGSACLDEQFIQDVATETEWLELKGSLSYGKWGLCDGGSLARKFPGAVLSLVGENASNFWKENILQVSEEALTHRILFEVDSTSEPVG